MSGLSILFATSEMLPLVKTGGLADVSYSLPRALGELGHRVRVVLPDYPAARQGLESSEVVAHVEIAGESIAVVAGRVDGVEVLLIEDPRLDRAGNPYVDEDGEPWPDMADVFGRYCQVLAQLAWTDKLGAVDVLHLNDWQTGLTAALLHALPSRPAMLFTIHNLGYPGLFDRAAFERLDLAEQLWSVDALEYHNKFSFLKGGIAFADRISTVSPTYAREITTPSLGFGFDGLLRHRVDRLSGILNGIDTDVWNPAADPAIHSRYDAENIGRKILNKKALQAELGLEVEDGPGSGPLLVTVGRLVEQKGIDLIIENAERLIERGAELAVLGEGDKDLEDGLTALSAAHPGRVAVRIGFDEALAHRIEAGADIFLMPSRFEPCGLNQMYSMRYGTIPIVRRTGGLADSVTEASAVAGTGFVFDTDRGFALALDRALSMFGEQAAWRALQIRAMAQDFSWPARAEQYAGLYRRALDDRQDTGSGQISTD